LRRRVGETTGGVICPWVWSYALSVPFPDEQVRGLAIVAYDPGWPREFRALAARLQTAFESLAQSIDHIGSTAIPGLAAKDCIDIQIRVDDLNENTIAPALDTIGFRLRPEPWNRVEVTAGTLWPKLVFAPPIGERASNVHVRETASANARRNLLFRDFLRADDRPGPERLGRLQTTTSAQRHRYLRIRSDQVASHRDPDDRRRGLGAQYGMDATTVPPCTWPSIGRWARVKHRVHQPRSTHK
jgi:GrpB-like predicted nucleotidyltransferase (UPF0157 family)